MASSKIKGITIEIDGDTTKLGKALESAENSSKGLQSELKGINTLLKLDPSNVELLTQKQKLLTDTISSTEDKLKTLKNAQAQVQAQFDKGEITEQQFRDFQREIVATEQKLEGLKKEAKEFGSVIEQQMKVASDKVKELGGKVEEAGKKFGGLSATATAGLGLAVKTASDNEEAINKYIGSTGKAVEETERYKEIMENIYRNNYGESIADVADKMRIVSNILGDLPDDELQSVVEKSYLLEDAYDMDFQENIRGVSSLMKQFGITSEEAYELINSGAQNGLNQNQDLTDQIAEYSTYYADLGLNAYDFFGIMTAGAKDGAYQMDYLNDAIKEFGIRTKDNSTGTKEAFKALGFNADELSKKFAKGGTDAQNAFIEVTSALMNVKDEVKRNELGVQLFGTKWEDLGEDAVKAMVGTYDQVEILGKTVEETAETMYGGSANKAQEAIRSIQTAFAQLGEALLPILAPIAEKIAEVATKFSEMNPIVRNIILVITGLVAILAPVIIIIGKVITGVGSIISVGSKLLPLFSGIASFITGTIIPAITAVVTALGWPVIAIMAVIGVIVLLWNKCEWFREAIKVLWEGLKTAFIVAVEWLKGTLKKIGQFFVDLWSGIKKVFSVVGTWFKDVFTKAKDGIKNAFSSVKGFFSDIWSNVKNTYSSVASFFTNIFQKAWNGIKKAFINFTGFFSGLWSKIKNTFSSLGTSIGDAISGAVKSGINGVLSMIEKTINSAISLINGAIGIINKIPNVNVKKISKLSIPRLAEGDVSEPNRPYLAMLGDNKTQREVTSPVDTMKDTFMDALTEFTNVRVHRTDNQNGINELTKLMKQYMPQIIENMNQDIVLDDRTLVGKIAPRIDKQLGIISTNKVRGY